jgi:hypothetical protein
MNLGVGEAGRMVQKAASDLRRPGPSGRRTGKGGKLPPVKGSQGRRFRAPAF